GARTTRHTLLRCLRSPASKAAGRRTRKHWRPSYRRFAGGRSGTARRNPRPFRRCSWKIPPSQKKARSRHRQAEPQPLPGGLHPAEQRVRASLRMGNVSLNEQPTFAGILRWSEEQGAAIEQVQELVGVAGSGSTYEEALASTLEPIRWWQHMSTRQSIPPV